MYRMMIPVLSALAFAMAVSGANVTLYRFVLTDALFHSGPSIETCAPSYGGPLTEACTGGVAAAHLIGRRLAKETPAWLPPEKSGSSVNGTVDELVEINPDLIFLPSLSSAPVFDFLAGNWTPWCPVLNALNAPFARFSAAATTEAKTFHCPDVTVLEGTDMASNEKVTVTTDYVSKFHVNVDTGVVLVWTSFFGKGIDGIALSGITDAATEYALYDLDLDEAVVILFLEAASEETLKKAASDINTYAFEWSLVAIISTTGNYLSTPILDGNTDMVLASIPLSPGTVATADLAYPSDGMWDDDFELSLRVYLANTTDVTLDERVADSRWLAAQQAASLGYEMYDQANPVVGTVAVPISATGPTEPAGCGFDDCAMGQYLASVLATSPPMFVEDLDLTAGSSEGSHAGSAPVADADKTPSDPTSPVVLPADIALAHGGLHDGDGLPGGRLREADLSSRFAADTCRGRLRGLTVMRLLQASLDTAAGTASFLQFGGLRLGFLPADPTANRTRPTLVRAEVQNRSTGAFAPLVRTQLYSVAMTRATQGLPAFAPILDAPLLGDSVPCFAPGTANLRQLVRADVLANTPVAFAPADLIAADDETNYSAALAAGGLAAPDSAVVCAAKNALAGAPPDLVFDDGLASCVPCAAPLIPNAEADSCVAPPPPPPPPPPPDRTPAFIAGAGAIVIVCVVLGAAIAALLPMWRRRHCPVDPRQPFTVAYISTLNEAALRERHPDGVAKALRLIERTVAREAAAAGCVVARRLEAHHMIVAKDPARALRCAAAVLRALDAADWKGCIFSNIDVERRVRIVNKRRVRRENDSSTTSQFDDSTSVRSSEIISSEYKMREEWRPPIIAAGLWHGMGTIERDEHSAEAYGYRYGGTVTTFAAAAAMAARPWQVALPPTARESAEDTLWLEAGGRPGDLCDEDLFPYDGLQLRSFDAYSAEGMSVESISTGLRLAPPQLGDALFASGREIRGVATMEAEVHSEAGSLEALVFGGLQHALCVRDGRASRWRSSADSEAASYRDGQRDGDSAGVANTLAAALCAASGRLALQRVGVVCVYVPALRASLPGVAEAALPALFDPTADNTAASRVAPDEIVAAAAGAAAHSRLVALLDGYMYFAINAPDITTAQVPVMATQDALAITAAVKEITGVVSAAGVAVGAAFVGASQQTLSEREGVMKRRPAPVAVLGTAAERSRLLASAAIAQVADPACWNDHQSSAHASMVEVEDDATPASPPVLVAGDLAAELASFELEIVDLIAWPTSITCLLPPPCERSTVKSFTVADVRRRIALAVRVVRDRTVGEIDNGDGDGEWLYQVGAVGGKSAFAASNAAVAAVRTLGVAADFAPENADKSGDLPVLFAQIKESLAKWKPVERPAKIIVFAVQRATLSMYSSYAFLSGDASLGAVGR